MIKIGTLLSTILLATACSIVDAQWTDVVNNNINFEFRSDQTIFSGSDDGFPTYDAEPTVRNDFYLSSYGWYGWQCTNWSISSVPYQGDPSGIYFWGTNHPFTAEFQITLQAWESDNSDGCTYTSGDDDYWNGNAILRDGNTQMPVVYSSTDFRPCAWNPWLASGTGWIFPNAGVWNQIWAETWRYAAGDVASDPLTFGTIGMGQTKADINANRAVAVSSSAPLQYSDTYGESSADVWYSFTLDQTSTVTITTDNAETDFDTKAYLFYDFGNMITSDDDGGTGATSLISTQLCPGTYKVCIEGYSANTGLYGLTINVSAPAPFAANIVDNVAASCDGVSDGVASWSTSGGVAPFEFILDGQSIGGATTMNGLAIGNHTVEAVDACGTITSASFQIANGDVIAPVAVCNAAIPIDVIDLQSTTVDALQVNNGSSDNCAITDLSISPSAFSVSDVGLVDITLTATDANGNSSTCICVGLVQNVTGIEENSASARIRLMPNPSDGHFRLDLSELALSARTQLTILDPLGRAVHTTNPNRSILDMDLGHLPNGTYMLRLNDPQWDASTRIVVQR